MGTGGFAVPTFERLLESNHDIAMVVTMPLRGTRSGKTTPVRNVAMEAGIPVFDPENINDPVYLQQIKSWNADLFFVCDYGKILAPHVIGASKFGGINLHGSLLPKYRGAAPINRALLNGEPTVGVSVIYITPEVDAGPVVATSEPIPVFADETAVDVEKKLAIIGAKLIPNVVAQIETGKIRPIPQQNGEASKAPKLKKHEGEIDWRRSASEIVWQYQGLQPWPKIFTTCRINYHTDSKAKSEKQTRLIIGRIRPIDDNIACEIIERFMANNSGAAGADIVPGMILEASSQRMIVATGSGLLQIYELQPEGRTMTSAADFLRGHPLAVGQHFGKDVNGF
jgi:methionyl-tRNA formyltransferase